MISVEVGQILQITICFVTSASNYSIIVALLVNIKVCLSIGNQKVDGFAMNVSNAEDVGAKI